MTSKQDKSIETLEIVDREELTIVEGGVVWNPSCPSYPKGDDDLFAPFGPPPFGPIVLC